MPFEIEIDCPWCKGDAVEPVAFLYQSLRSKGVGKNLFTESPLNKDKFQLTPVEQEHLLKEVSPPKEPRRNLPAGPIALMAFLISWLSTSSLIIGKIGQNMYFLMTAVFTLALGVPFYLILTLAIKDFKRDIAVHKKEKQAWAQQYFCYDCRKIFTPLSPSR